MSREIYLEGTPLHEALTKWLSRFASEESGRPLPGEIIHAKDSLGRVTAEAVIARISSPFYHSSAMDGYAVRFAETFGASETNPKRLLIGKQAVYVDTGDPLPGGFNAVIMIEDINVIKTNGKEQRAESYEPRTQNEFIEIIAPATPWQNVRVIGEDIVATELILPENYIIRPVDLGAMLAGGHTEVMVRKKPKVVIIPTGTEIVEPGTELKRGDIIEYNSRILSGLISEWGGEPVRGGIVRDKFDKIKQAILDSLDVADLVVMNAGASAGSEDFTAGAIREGGGGNIHGVKIKPGKT